MSAPLQLALGGLAEHRNHYLFSDHYLDHLLPDDPRWIAALPEARALGEWLRELYAREGRQLKRYNEAQLEDHWFRPILERLGHVYEAQASVPGLEAEVKRPDYVFFPDEAARRAAVGQQRKEEFLIVWDAQNRT